MDEMLGLKVKRSFVMRGKQYKRGEEFPNEIALDAPQAVRRCLDSGKLEHNLISPAVIAQTLTARDPKLDE